ncbi:MAG: CHASE2 domain-containing protein, partial [Calditrichota bacterium]
MPNLSSVSKSEPWWGGILLIIGVALAAYIISLSEFFETLDHRIYDFYFQWRGKLPTTESPLAIAAIDQRTADSLSFPFDRRHYGELIDHLDQLGAKWIVLDVDFSSVGANPASDSAFKAAISRCGKVVLAGKIDYAYHSGLRDPLIEIVRPVPQIASPKTPFGLVNDYTDADGVSRRYPLFISVRDTAFLSLGLKTLALLQNLKDVPRIDRDGYCLFGDLRIPMMDSSTCLLNYYGPAGTFPVYSFIDIINGVYDTDDLLKSLTSEERALLEQMGTADQMKEVLAESPFKDKIVLVGATAEDLHDDKATPFFTTLKPLRTPGVEVHAHALQMLLDTSFLRPIRLGWMLLGTLLISFFTYLTGRFWTHWRGLAAAAGLIMLAVAAGFGLFETQGLWLREMPLLLTATIGYPVNLLFSIIKAQREKALIRSIFGH